MRRLASIAFALWPALGGQAAELSPARATSQSTTPAPPPTAIIGRRHLQHHITRLILPQIQFQAIPLAEVVSQLSALARQADPAGRTINFLILDPPRLPAPANTAGDPATQPPPLRDTLIHVREPLADLTLRRTLEVICRSAETPLQFCLEEYAITFIPRIPAGVFSRTLRTNPDSFRQGLPGVVSNQ